VPDAQGESEIAYPFGPAIQFEVFTLAAERLEVRAECTQPAAMDYFTRLLNEIASRWPEVNPSARIQQAASVEKTGQTKILVVFASPKDSSPLRLEEEARIIRECIERSNNRENLAFEIRQAARVKDVRRALLERDYKILHFSGHGAPSGNLAFENETGEANLVPQQALANLLSNFNSIECVLLNACDSVSQGGLISRSVPFTIAMDGPISDDAAKHFTAGFYDGIGAGKDYRFAYKIGCNAIEIEGYSDASIPKLFENGSN
jgi:hypothetical protein